MDWAHGRGPGSKSPAPNGPTWPGRGSSLGDPLYLRDVTDLKFYAKTFVTAGAIIGTFFHLVTREPMPWWPDTAIMGAVFGFFAVLVAVNARTGRETNHRIWGGLKTLARRTRSNF